MKIVHFAPFAPNASGMYEAARDMVVADFKSGHDVHFVDVGAITDKHEKIPPKVGQVDDRGGTVVTAESPGVALDADILIFHTGVPDNWVVKTQAPIIFIMHGRPSACFYTEHMGKKISFSLMREIGLWPRVKAMLTFWPLHVPFWESIIDRNKIVCLAAPPVDEARFSSDGEKYDFGGKGGKYNVVISDQWRDDVNMYEILNGAICAAKQISGLKFHIFTLPNPLLQCWEFLTNKLKELDALGVMWGRRNNMEEVYRAADIVLSPQRIATRSVSEPLSCGTPVIADIGCEYATYQVDARNPNSVAGAIKKARNDLILMPEQVIDSVKEYAKVFSLKNYSEKMNELYRKILGKDYVSS